MSINRVIISGNLTREPDLRATGSGLPVLNLGVAVNDRRKNQQTGLWEDFPNFIDCVMFGTRAESLSKLLYKGIKVSIEGKLRWSQWERDGQKRSKIEVVIDELEFMTTKRRDEFEADKQARLANPVPPTTIPPNPFGSDVDIDTQSSVYDEDIPF